MEKVVEFIQAFWGVLGEMSPYLLFGFAVAGILSVLIPPEWVERHLGRGRFWPVLKASAFGVPLPLCSCGVIPVSAGLYRHGAGRGATTAFLISTPQTGVDSILVTFSLLGPAFAIFRPFISLASGVLGGVLAGAAPAKAVEPEQAEQVAEESCGDDCSEIEQTRRGRWLQVLTYGFGTLPRDIGKSLLVGLLLAALISALLPPQFLGERLGLAATGEPLHDFGVMLVMMLFGVPLYVCATASVPVAAALILHQGISPGAALVFLMTGPATNAATIVTIWKVMGRRTAVVYVGTVIVSAVAGGLVMDYVFRIAEITPSPYAAEMLPGWFKTIAAIVLLAVLGWALLGPKLRRGEADAAEGGQAEMAENEHVKLEVQGMTCSHCQANVQRTLAEQPGVTQAEVDLDKGVA
ncbi:MAG: SO_0444 family Cu/Zn efflux transporter, partial [Planctomycetota bacterium]